MPVHPDAMAAADIAAAIRAAIRIVPDFPRPGIQFSDITPILADPELFVSAVAQMTATAAPMRATAIVAVESRGFLFGAPMALNLGLPLVPVRKPGKLPAERIGIDYGLEYGQDRLELHSDAIGPGDRVLLVDDVLATGGTVKAAAALVRQLGGDVVGAHFLIAIGELDGAAALAVDTIPCHALITQ